MEYIWQHIHMYKGDRLRQGLSEIGYVPGANAQLLCMSTVNFIHNSFISQIIWNYNRQSNIYELSVIIFINEKHLFKTYIIIILH